MARKNEGILDLLCILPWQISVVLGLIAYLLFHFFIPTIEFTSPILKLIAPNAPLIGNILGALCLLCAIFSASTAFIKSMRLDAQKNLDSIRALGWQEFEELVGEAFRRDGFSVRGNEGAGPDGGVDLVLSRGSEKYLVQCKQWKAFKVGVQVVREMYGLMTANGATGGFVVTSGGYTKEAEAFARGKSIKLIAGPELWEMIRSVQMPLSAKTCADMPTAPSPKLCPSCGKGMVVRTARRGQQAGQKFWGCSGYPLCKNTLPIES